MRDRLTSKRCANGETHVDVLGHSFQITPATRWEPSEDDEGVIAMKQGSEPIARTVCEKVKILRAKGENGDPVFLKIRRQRPANHAPRSQDDGACGRNRPR
jgi:hypothetical protein